MIKSLILFCLFPFSIVNAQQVKNNNENNEHTFLGVNVSGYLERTNGVLINGVYKSQPAEKYGLKRGDSLLSINNKIIHNYFELIETLDNYKPGDQVEVTFIRNHQKRSTNIPLGLYPEYLKYTNQYASYVDKKFIDEFMNGKTEGLRIATRATLLINIDSKFDQDGVIITEVKGESPVKDILKVGDVIYKIDDFEFNTAEEMKYYLSKYTPGQQVKISYRRNIIDKSVNIQLVQETIYHLDKKKKDKTKKML